MFPFGDFSLFAECSPFPAVDIYRSIVGSSDDQRRSETFQHNRELRRLCLIDTHGAHFAAVKIGNDVYVVRTGNKRIAFRIGIGFGAVDKNRIRGRISVQSGDGNEKFSFIS